jgi:hypothetical protein
MVILLLHSNSIDVCYLFFLAEFLIDSGMSVVADQRYMKLWSEVLAPRAYCT